MSEFKVNKLYFEPGDLGSGCVMVYKVEGRKVNSRGHITILVRDMRTDVTHYGGVYTDSQNVEQFDIGDHSLSAKKILDGEAALEIIGDLTWTISWVMSLYAQRGHDG
jgi:hypothetical protein